jgi:hypothetical protein
VLKGEGMRHNVMQHCDSIARLPISGAVESLNVSNAAAIASLPPPRARRPRTDPFGRNKKGPRRSCRRGPLCAAKLWEKLSSRRP